MRLGWRHRLVCVVAVIAVASQLLVAAPALAAGASKESTAATELKQKRAEQTKIAEDLASMRQDLAVQVADYIQLTKDIERTRLEVSEVSTELASMNVELVAMQQAVVDRAVELYRSDRVGLLAMLFDAGSMAELMDRLGYLIVISRQDSHLIDELRLARSENLWLQQSLTNRMNKLTAMQDEAEVKRTKIEDDLEAQQAKAAAIGEDIAKIMRSTIVFAGSAPNGEFNPDTVISDASYRSSESMTAQDVQAFLEQQSGTLSKFKARDHNGAVKTAAEMIADAGRAWNVSPKVILVTLQKEQSLLSDRSVSQRQYDWAMGCGKADSRTFYQYQGFGRQIWFGAQKLSENARPWKPGIQMKIDGSIVSPTNSSTYSLYKYTPHFRGTMSFWLLYWRYFGDPLI